MQMRHIRLLAHDVPMRWHKVDKIERFFIAIAIIGFVGLIASGFWMLLD